ncbi:MAG TPA: hypothetical protein VF331_00100 [Polyangiales bacterium]
MQYCECDGGCCPPNKSASYTLDAKTVDGTIDWPGLQWQGASDTNTPYGPPFPPGRYFVMVSLDVPGVGVAMAGLPITVN